MTDVSFGLQLHGDLDVESYPRLAARAEQLGFEDITLHDVLMRRPVWPVLVDMARATQHLAVGPNVTHPYLQHPALIAANLRHLDEVSGGRAVCGLGRGSMYDLVERRDPSSLGTLAEAITLIRALLAGDTRGVAGERFGLRADTALVFGTPRRLPIHLGSLGPRGAALAGRMADGLRAAGQWEPSYAAMLRRAALDAARQAGRDAVTVIAENWTFVHPDRERARHDARVLLATFLPHLGPLLSHHRIPEDEVAAAEEIARFGRTDQVGRISDRTVDCFMAAGDVDDLVRGIHRLADAGIDTISFSGRLGPDTDLAVELLGEAIRRTRNGVGVGTTTATAANRRPGPTAQGEPA